MSLECLSLLAYEGRPGGVQVRMTAGPVAVHVTEVLGLKGLHPGQGKGAPWFQ